MKNIQDIKTTAKEFLKNGLNPVPLKEGGKIPIRKLWVTPITPDEIDKYTWAGIGFCTGSVSGGVEAIDFDCHNAEDPQGLMKLYSSKIPKDIIKKMTVVCTPSGGYHWIYKTNIIEGNQKLAVLANKVVIIETRGEGGYLKHTPSDGYTIAQGDILKIKKITDQERETLLSTARSLNQYSVKKNKIYSQGEYVDPFPKYNSDSDIGIELLNKHGWTYLRSSQNYEEFTRPGKTEGISGGYNLEEHFFWCWTTSSDFESERRYSNSAIYCILEHAGDFKKGYITLGDMGYGKKKKQTQAEKEKSGLIKRGAFWTEEVDEFKGIIYTFFPDMAIDYLSDLGFCKYEDYYIQIIEGIANEVTKKEAFNELYKEIRKGGNSFLQSAFVTKANAMIMNSKTFMLTLFESSILPLKDTEDTSYHCYKNCVVKVVRDKKTITIPYDELDGFVWEDNVIPREYEILPIEVIKKSMYYLFLKFITGKEERGLSALLSSLGYLMHNYKTHITTYAVIISDLNKDSEGEEPMGGSGKGILKNSLGHIVRVLPINGKNARFDDRTFIFSGVKDSTNVICIDDIPRNFPFEHLFSIITGDLPVERKGVDVKPISYQDSPKILITANYLPKGFSGSFKRRRNDVLLCDHYNANHTPYDDFQHELFTEWGDEEWLRFDNVMMELGLKPYLDRGLIHYENEDVKFKKLISETDELFYTVMEEKFSQTDIVHEKGNLKHQIVRAGGDEYEKVFGGNNWTLKRWIDKYAIFKGWEVVHTRVKQTEKFKFGEKN